MRRSGGDDSSMQMPFASITNKNHLHHSAGGSVLANGRMFLRPQWRSVGRVLPWSWKGTARCRIYLNKVKMELTEGWNGTDLFGIVHP